MNGGPGMPVTAAPGAPRLADAVGEEPVGRILTENAGRAFGVECR